MMSSVVLSLVLTLSVPPLGVSDTSVFLVWNNIQNARIADYVLYVNGERQSETADNNSARFNDAVSSCRSSFYAYFTKTKTGLDMTQTAVCSFCADNLVPSTEYSFVIAAVDKSGKEIALSKPLAVKTFGAVPVSSIMDITSFGAASAEVNYEATGTDLEKQKKLISSNTKAVQRAINECPADGTVFVPRGNFAVGSLHLKSNMTLRIEGTLTASPYASDYDYGFLMYTYYTDKRFWGIINADGAENLKICGTGTVNGSGWKYEDADMNTSAVPQTYAENGDSSQYPLPHYMHSNFNNVKSDGILARSCAESYLLSQNKNFDTASSSDLRNAYSTRSTLVILRNVKGLLISGLTFKNPANHVINIVDSSDISITGIREYSYDCNNGDGIGLICSHNAFIWNNLIDTGDDSIVFSAGVGKDALKTGEQGVYDVRIFNNYIHHGHGGVASGSHTALGIYNIVIEDTVFSHTDIPLRCKSAPANGGEVKDIVFRNNAIAEVESPFVFTTAYSDSGAVNLYGAAEKPAVFHHITVQNVSVYGASRDAVSIDYTKGFPHHDIVFENVTFAAVQGAGEDSFKSNKKSLKYKDVMFKK
jgi:exo-poly-alpha-galacturonosidase